MPAAASTMRCCPSGTACTGGEGPHLQRLPCPAQCCLVCRVPEQPADERQRCRAELLQAQQHEWFVSGGGGVAVRALRAVLVVQGTQLTHAQSARQPDAGIRSVETLLPVDGGALPLRAACKRVGRWRCEAMLSRWQVCMCTCMQTCSLAPPHTAAWY